MRRLPLALLATLGSVVLIAAQPGVEAPQSAGDRIQAYLDDWRASAGFPGASVGVVFADGSPEGFATGVSDRATGRPMQVDDLLLAGSTGKTFFAAVALDLIEAGRLDLDSPAYRFLGGRLWFKRLPNAADITVRMLMTHTSGLVRYETDPEFTATLRAEPDRVWTPDEQVAYLLGRTPPFAAGEGWGYADTNYIVLGMILEEITGTRLYDEVDRRFLRPLGLTRVVPSTARRIPGLVQGYAGPRDPLGLPGEVLVNGRFVINPQFEWTGGGYATSALDLARWGNALYTGKAVSPAMVRQMVEAAVPARLGPDSAYGLGVIVRPTTPVGLTWGHSGFFPGYLTELIHVVESGITVAVQVNTSARGAPGQRSPLAVAFDVADLAAGTF